jgi:predicted nucleotidyltransferase
MAYTEIKERNNRKYYYRVKSIRKQSKVTKDRLYLGCNLNKKELQEKEKTADNNFLKKQIENNLKTIKPIISKIIQKRGIKKAGIFGSYARGEQKKNSDIDILIEPTKKMGFFEIVNIEEELSKTLKKKIDLLTYNGINNLLKNKILNEEVRII